MNQQLRSAETLADFGFFVFPVKQNGKEPALNDWQTLATRDKNKIRSWWSQNPDFNVGISTSKYGENEALLVIDVDNKGDKKGDDEVFKLEMQGFEFPPTLTQITPTGGRHFIYKVSEAVKQGTSVLAKGIDTRSKGGYIVGAGSEIGGKSYELVLKTKEVFPAPNWIIQKCGRAIDKKSKKVEGVSQVQAITRAIEFLKTAAPAVEGESGDQTTYKTACRVKDLGVIEKDCLYLLLQHWNPNCTPPWGHEELAIKVSHAYKYGSEAIGAASPEADFTVLPTEVRETPIERLNREYAFIMSSGKHVILHETKDAKGNPCVTYLNENSFHKKFAAATIVDQGRIKSLTQVWMKHPARRSFDGVCFMPKLPTPSNFYNLWRGFTVEPSDDVSAEAKQSVEAFLNHALENVCNGNKELFKWLIGYFAHLIQKPWEKPLVALVFKGSKGTGKNALVERLGNLLGNHFVVTSDRRYLVGNFNGVLENNMLFVLDEAFWSGDKQAEGSLKNLITGSMHVIERKGMESYTVNNCSRVVIIGNEDWLVPATHDERRFAVFSVGDGRKQDRKFFHNMRVGMEQGGYKLLLKYFLEYDISELDVNAAPATEGLYEQKVSTLEPVEQWWLECLREGRVVGADFGGAWPTTVDKTDLRSAFRRYIQERQIRSRIPDERSFGKRLSLISKHVKVSKRRDGETTTHIYKFPPLKDVRADWSKAMGHDVNWDEDDGLLD